MLPCPPCCCCRRCCLQLPLPCQTMPHVPMQALLSPSVLWHSRTAGRLKRLSQLVHSCTQGLVVRTAGTTYMHARRAD